MRAGDFVSVLPISPQPMANNTHYIGQRKGQTVFIKLYESKGRFASERISCELLAEAEIRHPRMIDYGELSDKKNWAAYEWMDMKSFNDNDHGAIVSAAKLLSRIHRISRSSEELQKTDCSIIDMISSRISKISEFDLSLAERISDLRDRISKESFPINESSDCLIHGDFGWRNLAISNGEIIVYDFEHASLSKRYFDFGKIWDREILDRSKKDLFISAYENNNNPDFVRWELAMLPIRLWIAAGIFPYTYRKKDHDYKKHGIQILSTIKNELDKKGM